MHFPVGFLLFASYDSQGYGGGIRTRLHTGLLLEALTSSKYYLKIQLVPARKHTASPFQDQLSDAV
jgi:hypothetical protein